MRNEKTTRRVALAAGISGVIALPFVLRAWRSRHGTPLPRRGYEVEWEKYVNMLDVPVEEIGAPPAFTGRCRPHAGTRQRVVAVDWSYGPTAYPATFPQPPTFYIVTDGYIEQTSRVKSSGSALLVTTGKRAVSTPGGSNKGPGGQCIAVLGGGLSSVDFFGNDDDAPIPCSPNDVNDGCWRIAQKGLALTYPTQDTLTLGTRWSLPELAYGFEFPVELAGFVKVGAADAMKIVGKKHLNAQQVQTHISWMGRSEEEKAAGEWHKTKPSEAIRLEQKVAAEQQETRDYELIDYVELKSGITVRREFSGTIRTEKPERTVTSGGGILQLIDA